FGTAQRGHGGPRTFRGRDLQVNLPLTLEEIAEGVTKKIRVTRYVRCEVCGGTGAEPGTKPEKCPTCKGHGEVRQVTRSFLGQMVQVTTCPACHGRGEVIPRPCGACAGEGRVKDTVTVEIPVPAGVESGNYITLDGEGHAGPFNGPPGDLIVVFEEKRHKLFERHGVDILYNLTLSIPQAVLGAKLQVPTLNGKVEVDIPPGVQSGKVLRLRGKGIRHLDSSRRGDELVRIAVWIPDKLTPRERELFEELSRSEGIRPPEDDEGGFFHKMKSVLFGE
ncbi:MAG TPA: J domain-containing protein, partial [Bacteroidetes bacterium]|nr:J domain-containing protein [Bacteroidota bacterium]